ncbi:hypothetical protein DSO57_1021930 [Entomophthora muscae]|uniref:Uncharacterized protein n=1 Tax=Entomophthora muscae TaxID=34485 RepID=A0ACC2UNT5_9FUNG|nr:hypothetical protein DSO57_1021930 [Entomophthora muscae]
MPNPTISTPPTSDATGQSSQFLGVLYLALTGLIVSALPAAGPWSVAEKALFYLVKLGPSFGGPCQYLHLLLSHLKKHHIQTYIDKKVAEVDVVPPKPLPEGLT